MDQEAGVEMTARETAAVERTAVRIVLEWGTCPGHDNVVVVVHVVWCMWWAMLFFQKMGHHGEKRWRSIFVLSCETMLQPPLWVVASASLGERWKVEDTNDLRATLRVTCSVVLQ